MIKTTHPHPSLSHTTTFSLCIGSQHPSHQQRTTRLRRARIQFIAMARLLRASAVLALLVVAALSATPASAGGMAGDLTQLAAVVIRRGGGRTCRGGTVGECMEYLDVDAEGEGDVAGMATGGSKRRVLQGGSGYIGYDALRRDNVPCSQRGASYYNCQPGAEANPYNRGCSAITQCRG